MKKDDHYLLGSLLKTSEIKGEILLKFINDCLEEIQELESIFIDVDNKLVPFFIEGSRIKSNSTEVVKLEGIDNHWSRWTKTPTATFKYLPFGDYEFKVRAKVGNKLSTNQAKYSFKIQRPFLLSNIAVAIYLIALWLFSLLVHNLYKRYYKKQREKLLLKTQQDLELKELENQKQLMEYKNDKLKQDMENKNRELGISNMNLIKKNEFLNNIKKELKSVDNSKDISIYINSPGGGVYAGLGMYDTIQFIKPDVATICTGMAASMGAVLMCAGTKGKRSALPHSRIMIHQPSGGAQGQASDIEIQAREILKLRERLNQIYVTHTGQKLAKIETAMDRDNFMDPEEAKAFGLIDEIVAKRPEAEEA